MQSLRILITGGAGFIGSNFILHILGANFIESKKDSMKIDSIKKDLMKSSAKAPIKGAEISCVVNLDALTYAADLSNLEAIKNDERYIFIKGDICDSALVSELLEKYKINLIVHFAAESHVDNSITRPAEFVRTNINGTFCLLNAAYNAWFSAPNVPRDGFSSALFYHISTDEVFGSLGSSGFFSEKTPYAPNSPYSASKAASDHLVRSFSHTYGLNAVISNCSNNFGPHQASEKLIPVIISRAIKGEQIPIYGSGKNVRDWLFVKDHCAAICAILEHCFKQIYAVDLIESIESKTPQNSAREGFFETFCIGGENEWANLDLAHKICEILDKLRPKSIESSGVNRVDSMSKDSAPLSYKEQIQFVKDRAGHDFRYAIDCAKLKAATNFAPSHNFNYNLEATILWYLEKMGF